MLFYFCCDLNKLLINNDLVSVLGNKENAQGTPIFNRTKFFIFFVNFLNKISVIIRRTIIDVNI